MSIYFYKSKHLNPLTFRAKCQQVNEVALEKKVDFVCFAIFSKGSLILDLLDFYNSKTLQSGYFPYEMLGNWVQFRQKRNSWN